MLNATQQLASAIGVAAVGTIFFSTLTRSGFTAAISRSLEIQLGIAALLFVLALALPRRPRDEGPAGTEPPADQPALTEPVRVTVGSEPAAS